MLGKRNRFASLLLCPLSFCEAPSTLGPAAPWTSRGCTEIATSQIPLLFPSYQSGLLARETHVLEFGLQCLCPSLTLAQLDSEE